MAISKNEEFENALMKQLVKSGMKEETLKRISSDITSTYNMEILPEKVWITGQPDPSGFRVADGVVVQSRVNVDALERIKKLMYLGEFISVEVFPVGIVAPEALDLNIYFGNKVDSRMRNFHG